MLPAAYPDPTDVPFSGLVEDLKFNEDLKVVEEQTRKMLKAVDPNKNFLPGQPRICLDDGPKDGKDPLLLYLDESHKTDKLDELLPYMRFIFVQTPSHEHIMPLHHQAAHARDVKVTENPGLHLVWYHEIIYVKPIPAYFYSPAFWEYLENTGEKDKTLYKACVGFMRSYYMLIKYEIDFKEACKLGLIPRKGKGKGRLPSYEEWCRFIMPFARVGDKHVNYRYNYGELRLTRINNTAMFFRFRLAYYHIYPQWGSFLEHTLAPIITIFVVCSVLLDSMQVVLTAIAMVNSPPDGVWPRFVDASIWFPVVVMLSIAAILLVTLLCVGIMGAKDFLRGNRVRREKKRGVTNVGIRTHGMVW
ncbi:uncharacterized protein B0H64DRAFT_414500 [Chaetomium fimeti]|uniref:Uncharacterized protein n=1 Tax=Chaetomium fimeti TaxID=1854472 RepID=A0AAE0HQ39_9PEZI|nr:hypothetical protein B0H64DRAFT_414500 [Chaetomium fimeti]